MMGEVSMQERRKHPRVSRRISLGLSGADSDVSTETTNISVSGAQCQINQFIAPMTKLQLRLQIPESEAIRTIQCEGVVVRAEPIVEDPNRPQYRVAIFFTEVASRDRRVIEAYVNRHLDRPE